jgi:hypothetical protein
MRSSETLSSGRVFDVMRDLYQDSSENLAPSLPGWQTAPPRMKPYRGPPTTLGNAAAARVRLIVWCRDCGRQVEPAPGELAERYGTETTVIDWHARLTCSGCGNRQVDFVVTGTERR